MKYQQGKIKREHHTLKEFDKLLHQLATIEHIQRIIPGRISRTQQASSKKHVTFSYITHAGLKLNMKKGGTAQECFLIYQKQHHDLVKLHLTKLGITIPIKESSSPRSKSSHKHRQQL